VAGEGRGRESGERNRRGITCIEKEVWMEMRWGCMFEESNIEGQLQLRWELSYK
jgi:hypothetical protein